MRFRACHRRTRLFGLSGKISVAGKLRTIPSAPQLRARLTKFSMPSLRRRNGVPARGVETTKPGVSSTGQSLLKGNRDARNIHFLVRKFSTGELRLERRHCSQCCYVRRRRRLAGAFGPRLHHRRCLGDCFPQALMASQPTETGSPKGDPACARGIVSTSLAKYRKQGLLANAILKSTPLLRPSSRNFR